VYLKAFRVGSVLNNILDSAFCTTQRNSHKGLLLLFSCFVVYFVLLCSVSRLVNDIKYPVQNRNENAYYSTYN